MTQIDWSLTSRTHADPDRDIMKIIVPIKRVIDAYVTIQVKSDETGVETDNVKMSMNPFDEIAVEEAVRLQEAGVASEVIAVTIGDSNCQETLRNALAIGADRAVLIDTPAETSNGLQPLNIAKVLKAFVDKEQGDLVIMGKQAIDNDNNQTGQMLAGLLNWSQGTFISEQNLSDGKVTVTREVDGGLQTIALQLPAVLTTDLRLNEPRYIKLPNIMKAKKKPIDEITFSDLDLADNATHSSVTVLSVKEPAERQAGVKVANVAELVEKLRNETNVL